MKNIIIIPYYSNKEVERYLWIADYIKKVTDTSCQFEFLLSPAPSINPSIQLFKAFSKVASVRTHRCQTKVTGYPQRSTAVFWEIMEHINKNHEQDGGFTLWFESDMLPTKKDWIDRLEAEWTSSGKLILMGLFCPEWSGRTGPDVIEHINGGACYSKDIVMYVPRESRCSPFDVNLFSSVKATGQYKKSSLFSFATLVSLSEYLFDSKTVIIHGYRQNKSEFIQKGIELLTHPDKLKSQRSWFSKALYWTRWGQCCNLRTLQGKSFFCPIHGPTQPQPK